MLRVIEAIHAEARLGEEMRVPALAAWDIEHTSAGREREELDEPRDLAPIAREVEDGLVLEQVVRVEVGRPPLVRLSRRAQKKTGSR